MTDTNEHKTPAEYLALAWKRLRSQARTPVPIFSTYLRTNFDSFGQPVSIELTRDFRLIVRSIQSGQALAESMPGNLSALAPSKRPQHD